MLLVEVTVWRRKEPTLIDTLSKKALKRPVPGVPGSALVCDVLGLLSEGEGSGRGDTPGSVNTRFNEGCPGIERGGSQSLDRNRSPLGWSLEGGALLVGWSSSERLMCESSGKDAWSFVWSFSFDMFL